MLPAKPADNRMPGIDFVRGAMCLLIIVIHSAVPYCYGPMPGLVWPIMSEPASRWVDLTYWVSAIFIMPMFFAIAGHGAASLSQRLSPGQFAWHRFRRLLVPMLAAVLVILPICFYLTVYGWVLEGRYPSRKLQSLKFTPEDSRNIWGLGHLWYLQYLFIYSLGLAGFVAWRRRRAAGAAETSDGRTSVWRGWIGMCCLAMIGAVLFACDTRMHVGFRQAFFPPPAKFTYYLTYFAAGVLWQRGFWKPPTARQGLVCLAAAYLIWPAVVWYGRQSLLPDITAWERLAYGSLGSASAWLSVAGIWGVAASRRRPLGAAVSYLAEASYWVYLVHLPIVELAHVAMFRVHVPVELKFVLATLCVATVSLASYQVAVRKTWIGAMLGARRRASRPLPALSIVTPEPIASTVVMPQRRRERSAA